MRLLLILLTFMIFPGLSGCGKKEAEILLEEEQKESSEKVTEILETEKEPEPEITQPPQDIFVDICGAVTKPGVYRMPPDSRVYEAVEAAGGLLPEAAGNRVNQAQPLSDGQQIYVPTKEEAEKAGAVPAEGAFPEIKAGENSPVSENGKVNLNTADAAALQTLSGIGESKAQAILAYREEHGGFSSIEELMDVPGIKENTFLKIKEKIAVE